MNKTNQTLHQMLDDLHEASSNENKVLKLEIEALRADKAMKDEQLNMLYTVIEHHLGINVQIVYNDLEIQRVEERRAQREKELAEAATQKKKELIVETQEAGGSSNQPASNDVEMVDAVMNEEDHMDVDPQQSFVLVGEALSRPYNLNDVIRMIKDDYDDDEDQGATGLLIVKPSVQQSLDDFLNDEINEQQEDQHQESSSSGKQQSDQVFLTQPKVIYMNYTFEGVLDVPRTRAEMLEELGLDDGNLKFDIEDEIPSSPEKEYKFKLANEADNFNHVEVPQETLLEGRKNWFKVMLKERKFKRALQYFTDRPDKSLGDILSWGYLEDLKVYAIRREQGVQYFEFLSDIQTLPWWDVEELVQTKNIKQFYYGLDVKVHDQKLWKYIKYQAKHRFPDWKPQFPKQIVKIDPITKEKNITLIIKPPRCPKNMPLRAMEQDFYEDFEGWMYNQSIAEAVISLFDKKTGESRRISVLDPMWLVNCSKKDIECLCFNKIVYDAPDKVQA
ncbi:hypothetical protein Hanom_Chr07g00618281 [Helianthus anomalus]